MRRLAENFLSILAGDVARRLLGFFAVAYLARTITTSDFGIINIAFTILSYGLMTSSAGLSVYGARGIAQGEGPELVGRVIGVKLASAPLVYALIAAVVTLFVASPDLVALTLVCCCSLFVQSLLLEWYFQGKEEMRIIGTGRFTAALVYFLLVVIFVRSSSDLLMVGFAAIAGDLAAASLLMVLYRRRNRASPFRLSLAGAAGTLRRSLPLGAGSVLAQFSVNLPIIVIGIVMTNADAGIYSAASKLVFVLLMFDRVLGTLLLPASARLYARDPGALAGRLNASLRWIFIAALPLCVGGALLAPRLIVAVFGGQYEAAAPVMQILIWYLLFTMIHTVYTSSIVAVGRELEYSRVMLASAAVYALSIALCTLLYGLIGTACAVVGSEAVTLVLMRRAFHQTVTTTWPRSLPAILLAVAGMAGVLLLLPRFPLLPTVLAGAAVYFGILVATRAMTPGDLASLVRRA